MGDHSARCARRVEWRQARRTPTAFSSDRHVLITLGLFTFTGSRNDFLCSLIVLSDQPTFTLPVVLANLLGEQAQDVEPMCAGTFLTIAPMIVLFLALQLYCVARVANGGVKG